MIDLFALEWWNDPAYWDDCKELRAQFCAHPGLAAKIAFECNREAGLLLEPGEPEQLVLALGA